MLPPFFCLCRPAAPPQSHYNSAQSDGPPPIDQAIFKKYIKYSRAYVKPVLREVDSEKVCVCVCVCVCIWTILFVSLLHLISIVVDTFVLLQVASLYADLRAQSMVSGGVPIAVRHIER